MHRTNDMLYVNRHALDAMYFNSNESTPILVRTIELLQVAPAAALGGSRCDC